MSWWPNAETTNRFVRCFLCAACPVGQKASCLLGHFIFAVVSRRPVRDWNCVCLKQLEGYVSESLPVFNKSSVGRLLRMYNITVVMSTYCYNST